MAGKLFRNLTFWVFVAGMAGYGLAWFSGDPDWVEMTNPPVFYEFIQLIKTTFLALLKMLVAPIIFFSLIGGLLHIGDAARLRSLGSITLLYYIGTTCIAICIGLVVVFFIHPWVGNVEQITVDRVAEGAYVQPALYIAQSSGSFVQVMQGLLSTAFTNPFTALAQLNILAIATNAFMLGLAMLLVVPQSSPLVTCVHHMNDLLHKVLSWVLYTMPFGIFAIIFDVTLKSGGTLLSSLLGFCAVVVGGTLVHGLIVLPLIGKIFARMDVLHFFSKAAKPLMVAFATSSSSATLPVSMQTAEEELGVSDTVSSFVFPLGATMNMDGTALYEGVAAVFLAYLFGIDLGTTGMFVVFFMAMLSSIGAPGMPSGSMAGMQMVLLGAGIPLEAIGILLVVERPLDTIRTAVNVEGDMIGAMVTQRYFNKA